MRPQWWRVALRWVRSDVGRKDRVNCIEGNMVWVVEVVIWLDATVISDQVGANGLHFLEPSIKNVSFCMYV